jgi:general stress protein YciG
VNRSEQQAFPGPSIGFEMMEKSMPTRKTGGSKRGFAAMDPAKQREIASKGGKASHGGGRKASSGR